MANPGSARDITLHEILHGRQMVELSGIEPLTS